MWYRIAQIKIDPLSGQGNLDLGLPPKPIDISSFVYVEVVGSLSKPMTNNISDLNRDDIPESQVKEILKDYKKINALNDLWVTFNLRLKSNDRLLGHLVIIIDDIEELKISLIELNEFTLQEKANAKKLIGNSEGDMSSLSIGGWGLGEYLYKYMKSWIYKNASFYKGKTLEGDIHTQNAYKSRVKVFGEPFEIYHPSKNKKYTHEQVMDILPKAQFDIYGDSEIGEDYIKVRNKI
jgi:hypothetical protein